MRFVSGSKPARVTIISYSPGRTPKKSIGRVRWRWRRFFVGREIFQSEFRVGPNGLDLVRANGKDNAGKFCRLGHRERQLQQKKVPVGGHTIETRGDARTPVRCEND